MFKTDVAFFLGEEKTDGYSGVFYQDNLFFCLEIQSGLNKDQGHKIIDFLKEKIKEVSISENNINSLSDFDDFISLIITKNNFPSGFSLAAGYLKDKTLYLKTVGQGRIYIRREGMMGLLINGNNTASGLIEDGDFFIFLTDNFFQLIGGEQGLEKIFDHLKPNEIIDKITPFLKGKNDLGAVALFISFHHKVEDEQLSFQVSNLVEEKKSNKALFSLTKFLNSFWMTIKSVWTMMKTSKKTLTFITVVFLFLIFVWSVFLGIQRRRNSINNEKIRLTKDLINQKLTTAEEVVFLNLDRALILIKESKEEIEKLKQEAKGEKQKIKELEIMIQETENKILKKDLKNYSEFFDLTVDDKNAKGDRFYLADSNLLISNKEKGVIYNLSLEKKSLEKNQFSEIKSADFVAGFSDEIFFYAKDKGIYKIDNNKKLKKVIEKDSRWGKIIDMALYNGNIYLLDKDKDEIWKYLKAEESYSSASSYFRLGEAIDLGSINSLAIDGSIYLAGGNLIFKYTSGKKEDFKVNLPEKKVNFNKIFTGKDLEKIYLWDKGKGVIYVIGKTGEYIEQINSDILSNGTDFVVYKENIYVLLNNKVYKIE